MKVELFKRDGMRVIDVLRGDEIAAAEQWPGVALAGGRPGGAAHRDVGAAGPEGR
jgi:hypothetical protein